MEEIYSFERRENEKKNKIDKRNSSGQAWFDCSLCRQVIKEEVGMTDCDKILDGDSFQRGEQFYEVGFSIPWLHISA